MDFLSDYPVRFLKGVLRRVDVYFRTMRIANSQTPAGSSHEKKIIIFAWNGAA